MSKLILSWKQSQSLDTIEDRKKKKSGSLFHSIRSIDSPARPLITEGKSAVTIIRGSLSANWRARRFRSGCTFFGLESRLIAPSCELNTRIHVCRGGGAHSSRALPLASFYPHSLEINESVLRILRDFRVTLSWRVCF